MEVVLVVWVVLSVIRRLRGRGFASDKPDVRFDPATDRLSGENTRRNPGRTAATAAALMIGLALVTFIAVLANGMKQSNRRAIERQVKSTYMLVSANGFDAISPSAGNAIVKAPEVAVASNVRSGVGKASGSVQADHRPRSEDDLPGLQLRVDTGLERVHRRSRPLPGDRRQVVRGEGEPRRRVALRPPDAEGRHGAARGEGRVQGAALLPAARGGQHLAAVLRHALRAAAEPVHVPRREGLAERRDAGGARAGSDELPRCAGADARRVDHRSGRGLRQLPASACTYCSRSR